MKMNSINISGKISSQLQQKLSLAPGQVIKAQVISAEGSQVMLQLGSSLLKAQTKVPLNPGDRLKLQVASAHNNFVELKIMNDNAGVKQEDTVFLRLGLKPQEELQTILQQLVKFNLPVSQAALMGIYSLIKEYNLTEDLSQLMVWLKSVGVKVDSEKDIQTLMVLRKFFKGELSGDEEVYFLNFLNESENNILGGYNIFGWPVSGNHVYLLTQGSKHEQLQAESCKLFLQVNSRSFEELWFKIGLVNNTLNVGIVCNCDEYKTILDREVNWLSQALQTAGYNLTDIPVDVSKGKTTVFDLIPDPGQEFPGINLEV